ncbi:transporter substrate-binding domain-containing protein [Pokkaliibacter sp. MBI-7]|uniref:transporter substrate-binding domain-containing protein n=1 Tax=Pokkaliibacter sp. MBI-7 TaxID=3040600 RepID=UPI0024484762|nr:transporter substrate-binding domain-containing protein [Pokkaliibacter sp. MBI-7]MDH2434501.1 transporter substrate-binding domain-containing protein [Pokkaliibacter sp. MBI-7]
MPAPRSASSPATVIRRLRPTLLFLLCLLSWLPANSNAARNDTQIIVIGGDYDYPPYEFLNDQGEPDGYNVELAHAIADVMGIRVRIELGEWDKMRDALLDGRIDALEGISISPQREQRFSFAPPHAIIHQSIFARKGAPDIDSIEELRGKEVIVQKGGVMDDYLHTHNIGAFIIPVATHAGALRMLASGKGDYALVANVPALYLSKQLGLSNIVQVARPFQAQQYGFAVRKGNEEMLAVFSEGLAILKNTGRQQEIYNRWLGPLEAPGIAWKRWGQGAAIVSCVLLLILGGTVIWNRMLRRQVDKRSAELRQHQQQLIQADKLKSLGVLVSGVAHEINNPSALLLLNIPILRDAWQDAEELLEQHYAEHGDYLLAGLPYSRMRDEVPLLLKNMADSAERIKRIVDDLKDFARLDPQQLQPVDINTMVATAIRLADTTLRRSTQVFEVQYDPDLPSIQGSEQRLEQVVINLILNACQALTDRHQAVSVSTRLASDGQQVQIWINDQGRGIAAEHLPQLTDPFFTTKREQGGTGLGLSVSSGIVQAHGGSLSFTSTPGQGTQVCLSLPIPTHATEAAA